MTSNSIENQNDPGSLAGTTRIHLAYLDGMRAVAAVYVMAHHAFLTVWNLDSGKPLPRNFYLWGHFSVSFFIVISGFCLMIPVVRKGSNSSFDTKQFFLRRCRRILPPYYFALLFSLGLAKTIISQRTGTHWDISIPVSNKGLIEHLLLIHNLNGNAQINHAFWSIATECQIYLFFPMLVWLWRKHGIGVAVTVSVLLGWTFPVLLHVPYAALHYLGLFGFGMAGASIVFGTGAIWRKRVPWFWIAALLLIGTGFIAGSHDFRVTGKYPYPFDLSIGLAAMALLIAGVTEPQNPIIRLLSWKPIASIGIFSYSLYLIHAPLLQVLWQYAIAPFHLRDQVQFALLAGPGSVIIIAVAWLFFRFFERPFTTTSKPGAVT